MTTPGLERYQSFVDQAAHLADEAMNGGKIPVRSAELAGMARMFATLAAMEYMVATGDKMTRDIAALRQRVRMLEKFQGIREGESQMPDPFEESDQ